MNLLVDENIPFAEKIFSRLGRVRTVHGREITTDSLKDIDVLIVRSITQVNKSLLKNTPVKFVGTATIGTDHIDIDYLKSKSIAFSNAQASNANSVAEYIFTAIFYWCQSAVKEISNLSIGIVGIGHIGSIVAEKAEKLGMKVLKNDPPLQEEKGDEKFYSLEELLQADIITIHTPLTRETKYPTWHLFDKNILEQVNNQTLLINTSRGAVVDNQYLLKMLCENKIWYTILDVWEGEPDINMGLLEKVYLGTPHIAGYSYDGKVNGAVMIHNKICEFFNIGSKIKAADILPKVKENQIQGSLFSTKEDTISHIICHAFNIEEDSNKMKKMLKLKNPVQRTQYFDKLRKEYPIRREFYNYMVSLPDQNHEIRNILDILGFCSTPIK